VHALGLGRRLIVIRLTVWSVTPRIGCRDGAEFELSDSQQIREARKPWCALGPI
jgi:hypothetical protein